MEERIVDITLDDGELTAQVRAVSGALGGLETALKRVGRAMAGAFAVQTVRQALEASGYLDREFQALQRSVNKFRTALADAAAPVAAVVLPAISRIVGAAAQAVDFIGGLLRALLGVPEKLDSVTQSTSAMDTAVKAAAKTVKRSLAGFDELTRLSVPEGTAESTVVESVTVQGAEQVKQELEALSIWQKMVLSKLDSLFTPLKSIDFTPAVQAFSRLRDALAPIRRELFAGLDWAWHNLLVPLGTWVIEDALPVFLDFLAAALGTLGSVIEAVKPLAVWLWESLLQPIAQWTGGIIVGVLQALAEKLTGISAWIGKNEELVQRMTVIVGAFLAVWAVGKLVSWLTQARQVPGFFTTLGSVVQTVTGAVQLLCQGLQLVFQVASTGWSAAAAGFRAGANGMICFMNTLLGGITSGINAMLGALNQLSFRLPDWLPVLGGESLGFRFSMLSVPKIPALARGAVLPANRPFLAMVGDQRNGVNVEAPLSTIQEAVALVMEDQTAAILAGFEASVGVQREILEAVLGIRIGDDLIGQAAARYTRKINTARGGIG